MFVRMFAVRVGCWRRPEGVESAEVTVVWVDERGCWELNLGLQEEQAEFLNAEPSH